jgi:hypothetical protein
MDLEQILMSVVMTTVNYIFVTAISNGSQKQIVLDIKGDLRTVEGDILAQLKEQHVSDHDAYEGILSQVKDSERTVVTILEKQDPR